MISHTHLLQRFVVVFLRQEVDVSWGDDAHQLAAHFARFRDGDPREAMSRFGFDHIPDCVARTHHDRVRDEALLKPLKTENNRDEYAISSLNKRQGGKKALNQTAHTWQTEKLTLVCKNQTVNRLNKQEKKKTKETITEPYIETRGQESIHILTMVHAQWFDDRMHKTCW